MDFSRSRCDSHELHLGDTLQIAGREWRKHNDLIDAVQKLNSEVLFQIRDDLYCPPAEAQFLNQVTENPVVTLAGPIVDR